MNETKIFEAFQRLKELRQVTSGVDLQLAKELAYLKAKDRNEKERYKVIMGYDEATWKSFVAQPELNLSYEKAQRLVLLHTVYIEKFKLKEEEIFGVDSNSLCYVARRGLLTEKNVKECVEKAKQLSRGDFQREVRFGTVDEMKCKHEYKQKIVKTCSKCGKREIEKK